MVDVLTAAGRLLDSFRANIAMLDTAGRIVFVNQAWREFGAANGQQDHLCGVGQNYLDVCDRVHGADAAIASAVAAGVRATAAGAPDFVIEYPCHSPTEQHWFVVRVTRVELEGQVWLLVKHLDTTERKLAEAQREDALRALKERAHQNELYHAMIDTLPDFIFAKDRAGRFLAANHATARIMQAPSVASIIGRTDADFYPAAIAERFRADEEAFFIGGETVIIEQPGQRADGSPGWLCSLKTLLRDGQDQTIGYVGHGRDITEEKFREQALAEARSRLEQQADELRRLTAEAERANDAKSQFLAAMSHEIRTPMTGVLGMADLLAAEQLSPEQKRYVDTIRASGRHLLTVINDILDFSRLEAGRVEVERIDFMLSDVLEQVSSLMAPQAAARGLDLQVGQAIASCPVICGDPTRLRQVLVNLIGNALKFSSAGKVDLMIRRLAAAEGRERLRFEVRDTGIGIPPEQRVELFQPFVQADSSITRHFGGSGLGLAICRSLVTAMGGVIGCESEPGRGSTFWFELPFEIGDNAKAAERNSAPLLQIRPLRVLVVDDVAANRELMIAMLGRHGHAVALADDGAAAVEHAARGNLDVVADGRADAGDGWDGGHPTHSPAAPARRGRADPGTDGQRDGI